MRIRDSLWSNYLCLPRLAAVTADRCPSDTGLLSDSRAFARHPASFGTTLTMEE